MSINQELLEKVVRDMIQENPKFYNTPIKKPTKASTSAASSQKTWNGKENARPSGATQGAYDAIGTPGGVSPTARSTWTKDQLVAYVTQQVQSQLQFSNKPVVPTGKKSSSTQASWKENYVIGKASGATQGAYDAIGTPGGVSEAAKKTWTKDQLVAYVAQQVQSQLQFSNKPVVPTGKKSSSTQASWKENYQIGKASGATQGAYNAVGTPGGVSEKAKKTWTKDQLVAFISQAVTKELQFYNRPVNLAGGVSASTQPSWKDDTPYGRTSASTQASWDKKEGLDKVLTGKKSASTQSSWRKGIDGADYTMAFHAGTSKTPKF